MSADSIWDLGGKYPHLAAARLKLQALQASTEAAIEAVEAGGAGPAAPPGAPEKPIPGHGVVYRERIGRFEANIIVDRRNVKRFYLGSFKTREQAAWAYDKAAIKFRKHEAKLNYPLEKYPRGKSVLEHLDSISEEDLVWELRREGTGTTKGANEFRGVGPGSSAQIYHERLIGRGKNNRAQLGSFNTDADAARVYDRANIILRGPGASTNFRPSDYSELLERVKSLERGSPADLAVLEMWRAHVARGVSAGNTLNLDTPPVAGSA